MMGTVSLQHAYTQSVDEVWRVATDWQCLEEAVRGLVTYYGLPDTPIHQHQVIETQFSLFGILPRQPWTMEIRKFEPDQHQLESHEYGGPVRAWDHTLEVTKNGTGATLTDTIEIDAGAMTGLYVGWARFMYGRRHPARVRMLEGNAP